VSQKSYSKERRTDTKPGIDEEVAVLAARADAPAARVVGSLSLFAHAWFGGGLLDDPTLSEMWHRRGCGTHKLQVLRFAQNDEACFLLWLHPDLMLDHLN
jgi:hypothetical protein